MSNVPVFSLIRLIILVCVASYIFGGDGSNGKDLTFADRVSNTFSKAAGAVQSVPAYCNDNPSTCEIAGELWLTARGGLAELAAYAHSVLAVDEAPAHPTELSADEYPSIGDRYTSI